MHSNPVPVHCMAPYLQVYDMPTSLRFYRDQLGFEMVAQSQPERGDDYDWVLLRWNNMELMLNTIYEKPHRPSSPDPLRLAGHSDVVLYFSTPDIEGMYSYLRSKGLDIKEPYTTGYNFTAINFTDPDGYGICFHRPG